MHKIGARQVHLDFHTSKDIAGIGARFDKKQWQKALKLGNINVINIFAKCHHGWSYYPTQIGNAHPHLSVPDLMGAQIEACHEIGVKCPIYYTVSWAVNDAEQHPEWRVLDRAGKPEGINVDFAATPDMPRPHTSWEYLCPSGDYLKVMLDQTVEICDRYPVDGLWYDITNCPYERGLYGRACYCPNCRRGMAEEGVNIDDPAAAEQYAVRKWKRFYEAARALVLARHPEAVVYFNGTTGQHQPGRMWEHNLQQDLEDLPTTWGGYNKFPLRARYFQREGRPYVAMSGKFHTSWGEFGGFKHPDALRFEASAMIAFGARCNFGDQLHPSGEMDIPTYKNIGEAFRYVRKIESYGLDGRPCSTLGVWWIDNSSPSVGAFAAEPNLRGVSEMLLENQIDFEIVENADDLSRFAAIILGGSAGLKDDDVRKLEAYRKQGGKLLVMGESGLDAATRSRFILNVGAEYVGCPLYKQDYLQVGGSLGRRLVASPFLNCAAALRAKLKGAKKLADIREPYFDRTYGKYCSHRNTPYRLETASQPGAWVLKDLVYLAHPVGYLYHTEGARLHREYFLNALRMVYPLSRQVLATALPSGGRVSLVHQPDQRRYCAHLLYGPPTPRGCCQVIEDLVPLYDIPVTLRVPEKIRKVHLPVSGKKLRAAVKGRVTGVTVPVVQCHEVVVFEY